MTYIPVDPYTPHTDKAEHQIRRILRYLLTQTTLPLPYLKALAVMNYVAGHLSAPLYGDMKWNGDQLPTGDRNEIIAEKALAADAGLCGQATATALVLYKRIGVRARQVDITHDVGTHTTVEVRYDYGWHWFDPTFGYWYTEDGRVLSVEEAIASDAPTRRINRLWGRVIVAERLSADTGHDVLGSVNITWSVRPNVRQ